jgi:DNA invertase Pin-like site-specific DNA recombinase
MRAKKPLVISYVRFSRPEQIKGDSLRRQLETSEKWAKKRNLTISKNNSYHDLGVSAYRGANQMEGKLGAFLRIVRAGRIPRGSYLLVESLDRLSRQNVRTALRLFLEIVEAGITIVTLIDEREYAPDKCEELELIQSIVVMARAAEESKTKGKRVADAWHRKREKLRDGSNVSIYTKRLPFWLKVGGGKIVVDSERAAVVKRIFKMSVAGHGGIRIVKTLNEEGIPGPTGKRWHSAYLSGLLHDRSVIGDMQLGKVSFATGKRRLLTDGEPVKGYFPPILTENQFLSAQQATHNRRRSGGPSAKFVNIFSGLLYSHTDKSKLVINDKGSGRRYVSSASLGGIKGAAPFCGFPVQPFETAMIVRLHDPATFSRENDDGGIGEEIAAQEAKVAAIDATIVEVQDSITASSTASVVSLLGKLDAKKREADKVLTVLRERQQSSGAGYQNALEELRAIIVGSAYQTIPADERLRIRQILRGVVERIDCLFKRQHRDYLCSSIVTFRSGQKIDHAFRAKYTKTDKNGKPQYDLSMLLTE